MSQLGHLCHFDRAPLTSALPRLADIRVLMAINIALRLDILRAFAESCILELHT